MQPGNQLDGMNSAIFLHAQPLQGFGDLSQQKIKKIKRMRQATTTQAALNY
jgi:hypothetical protein